MSTVNRYLRQSNPQLMPSELKIQYCYLHSNETDRKKRLNMYLKSVIYRLRLLVHSIAPIVNLCHEN